MNLRRQQRMPTKALRDEKKRLIREYLDLERQIRDLESEELDGFFMQLSLKYRYRVRKCKEKIYLIDLALRERKVGK